MPTYEFFCETCGVHFDSVRHVNDSLAGVPCPSKHNNTRRIFSAPSIVYKGSGFYSTDHPKKESKLSQKSD